MGIPAQPTASSSPGPRSGAVLHEGSPGAQRVLREMLDVLPDDHLVLRAPAVEIPAVLARDESWLREQIRLRGKIWRIDDPFVLGTLWWYSASNWLVMPTVTSWFTTGRALSARLEDLLLFHQPDSRIPGSRSLRLGPSSPEQIGDELRESLADVVTVLAAMIGKGERRLWSFVVDAIAGRMLWAAAATGRAAEVQQKAGELVAVIGQGLPQPRMTSVEKEVDGAGTVHHHVRRGSCCLLYQVPDENKCSNCPRQLPEVRLARLASG